MHLSLNTICNKIFACFIPYSQIFWTARKIISLNIEIRIVAKGSKECRHTRSFNQVFSIDVIIIPGVFKVLIHISLQFFTWKMKMSVKNFGRSFCSWFFIKIEFSWRKTSFWISHFFCVSSDHGMHKHII